MPSPPSPPSPDSGSNMRSQRRSSAASCARSVAVRPFARLVLGQPLTAMQAAGALLVLASVWLGQRAAAPATVARAQPA
ncbi:hypothetical protein [Cupriavidus sp. MP-37]|uniref:hypothetical protein n=1 Tax=Cupriavidus sp. MP-37 TaxID=2884455 RepID=UPI001D0A68F1|nr:hypothetical protein [Cupriavidus sp. MP-37]UDM50259.1 hypothetical protein LIN44_00245 [Cupriavidus sp. MP-37]